MASSRSRTVRLVDMTGDGEPPQPKWNVKTVVAVTAVVLTLAVYYTNVVSRFSKLEEGQRHTAAQLDKLEDRIEKIAGKLGVN